MDLKVGMPAPDFTLPLATFGTIALSNMRGKPVILYFYPKDDTPGCTTQACEFRDALSRFADFDAAVIGISKDTVESHAAFARKFGLNFHLASDATGRTCEDYGVWGLKSVYGEPTMGIERTTFLIDRHGIIRYIWRKVAALGHAEEVRTVTEALHHGQPLPGDGTLRDATGSGSDAPKTAATVLPSRPPSSGVVVPLQPSSAASGSKVAPKPVTPKPASPDSPAAGKPTAKAKTQGKAQAKAPAKPAAKPTPVPAKKKAVSQAPAKKPAGGKKPSPAKPSSKPAAVKKKKPVVSTKPASKSVTTKAAKKPAPQAKNRKPVPKVAAKKPVPSKKKPSPVRKVSSSGAKKVVKKAVSPAKSKKTTPSKARRR